MGNQLGKGTYTTADMENKTIPPTSPDSTLESSRPVCAEAPTTFLAAHISLLLLALVLHHSAPSLGFL